jgi:hypothetical protein
MDMLAVVYDAQKRYNEAKSLLTRVLHARKSILGSEHSDMLSTKHSLAIVYLSQRHDDAAAMFLQQVRHASEKQLGLQHPSTLPIMYYLACVERCGEAACACIGSQGVDTRSFAPSYTERRH